MPKQYVAGVWAKKYRQLPNAQRRQVNQLTNHLFQKKTNVIRKLSPTRDRALCDVWLELRDQVMQQRERPAGVGPRQGALSLVDDVVTGVGRGVQLAARAVESIVQEVETPWMDYARAELRRGVAVVQGKKANARIMMYSRTCSNLYETKNKEKYMNRNGDEGFKWCSTFVNWCMKEAGIKGTQNARALSWLQWGKPIPKAQHGAVVILKTKSWNHVAFVAETSGGLKMLGGNQKPEHGKGPQCVSYQRIKAGQVVGYRMPK